MTKEKDWWDVPKSRDDRGAQIAHENLVRALDKTLAGVDLRESDIKKAVHNYLENRAFESRARREISPDQIVTQPPSPSYQPGRPAPVPEAKESPMRFYRKDRDNGPDFER